MKCEKLKKMRKNIEFGVNPMLKKNDTTDDMKCESRIE